MSFQQANYSAFDELPGNERLLAVVDAAWYGGGAIGGAFWLNRAVEEPATGVRAFFYRKKPRQHLHPGSRKAGVDLFRPIGNWFTPLVLDFSSASVSCWYSYSQIGEFDLARWMAVGMPKPGGKPGQYVAISPLRSEERRVGKECRL